MAEYSKHDLADALEALWEELKKHKDIESSVMKELMQVYPCVYEIELFGANGPVGLGLGKIGGHAIGE